MRARSLAFGLTLIGISGIGACHSDPPAPTARVCTIAMPSSTDWRLRADGTFFRDAQGRIVLLRGVNAGGRSKFAPNVPFDFASTSFDAALAAYMDRAAAWGLTVLRVPFTWNAVEPTQGMDDEAFLKHYDAILDAAWARGIRTIVDFHQDVYAENFCGDGFPPWTLANASSLPAPHHDCPDWPSFYLSDAGVRAAFDAFWAPGSTAQTAYLALWDRMVARYKDRPGVVGFEPFNEPASGTAESGAFERTTLTDFYSRMIARMRAAAPTSLVFVEPTGIDGGFATTTLQRPTGDGIVFAPHYYPIGALESDVIHMGLGRWADVAAAWNVPVFVGEFGTVDRDGQDGVDDMTWHWDAFDERLMSGTQWEYSVAAEDWNAEGMSLVDANGTEHRLVGALVRPYARATAGHGVTTGFDVGTRVFTLAYAPDASGVSEIALPTRAAPNGVDVELAGGCYDDSHAGVLLVQSDPGATNVSVKLTVR
jgi:endoglycosylceramidase